MPLDRRTWKLSFRFIDHKEWLNTGQVIKDCQLRTASGKQYLPVLKAGLPIYCSSWHLQPGEHESKLVVCWTRSLKAELTKISFLGKKRSGTNQSKQWVILVISHHFSIVLARWQVPSNNYIGFWAIECIAGQTRASDLTDQWCLAMCLLFNHRLRTLVAIILVLLILSHWTSF